MKLLRSLTFILVQFGAITGIVSCGPVDQGVPAQTATASTGGITTTGGSAGPVGTVNNAQGFTVSYVTGSNYTYRMHQNYLLSKVEDINGATAVAAIAVGGAGQLTPAAIGSYSDSMPVRFTSNQKYPTGLKPNVTYFVKINGAKLDVFSDAALTTGVTITSVGSGLLSIMKQTSDFSQPCQIASTATGQDLSCILEAKEEDLWLQGAALNLNVPAGMCYYMFELPYYYYTMAPGILSTDANISVDVTSSVYGNVVLDATEPAVKIQLTAGGAGYNVTCDYDYSASNLFGTGVSGPNCCVGNYNLTINDTVSGKSTTSVGKFTGNPANCLDGPAMTYFSLQPNGYPFIRETYVNASGLNSNLQITQPWTLNRLGAQMRPNIYAANYMNTWDATKNDYLSSLPASFSPPASTGVQAASPTNRYYTYECMDRGRELINRINVEIRTWDSNSEWDLMNSGITKTNLSPNTARTTGAQLPYSTSCPMSFANGVFGCASNWQDTEGGIGNNGPITDHADWRAFAMMSKRVLESLPQASFNVACAGGSPTNCLLVSNVVGTGYVDANTGASKYTTGMGIQFSATEGNIIGGKTYYVITNDSTHIQLAKSLTDALTGQAITALGAAGGGARNIIGSEPFPNLFMPNWLP